jgi:hemerythrin-like domain-containing protein
MPHAHRPDARTPSARADVAGRAETLRRLYRDHVNIARLLEVLEHQVALFAADDDAVDYEVMDGVLEYLRVYPDAEHHPREDRVLGKLRTRDPAGAAKVGDLAAEHARLRELTGRFTRALAAVLGEAEISREGFDTLAGEFLIAMRAHMRMEEELFFPLADAGLTAEDWAEIDAATPTAEDPLFGTTAATRCEALRQHLLAWDAEDRAAAGR